MKKASLQRVGGIVVAGGLALGGSALPASALSLGISGTGAVHVADCRTAALARQAAYNLDFSSKTTGALPVHLAAAADAALTLCYSLDVKPLTTFNIVTESYVTVDGIVSGLLTQTDASKVCTALRLTVAPGVTGKVSATSHAHVLVDGAPPADWDHEFAKDVSVSAVGEDIVLRTCADTAGNVTTS